MESTILVTKVEILRACIGLLKLNINESTPTVDFVGISPGNNYHIFYPAIGLNKDGNLVMLYGTTSSPEIYPHLLVMILDKNLNILNNTLLINGDGNTNYLSSPDPRNGKRFGDYFTVTDPIDKSVWMSGEYGNKNLQERWSTYVGNIS